ncbi:MAG: hypothetical protein WCC57_08625 [Paracoccaceae bacterium]
MKRQYLGDSKDSFKWDYHDHLVRMLGYQTLKVAWMMKPDDGGTDGSSAPELFPARPEVLRFCNQLKASHDPGLVTSLPSATEASYSVALSEPVLGRDDKLESAFFHGIKAGKSDVVFLDPDNGFEPEKSSTDRHVRYNDLETLVRAAHPDAVITVFQHHRRRKFPDDFARIRERIVSGNTCAIYWHSLMFVCISSSHLTMARVREINHAYAAVRPVIALD